GEIAEAFAEAGGAADDEAGGDVGGFLAGGADILAGGMGDAEEGDVFEIGVIVIIEDEAGVDAADHHGLLVFAGVFVGALDFRDFVHAFDAPVAACAARAAGVAGGD